MWTQTSTLDISSQLLDISDFSSTLYHVFVVDSNGDRPISFLLFLYVIKIGQIFEAESDSMQNIRLGGGYLSERWDTLVNTTQQFLGSLFANPIPYLLALLDFQVHSEDLN